MMKKTVKGFVSILLVLTMVFALAACSQGSDKPNGKYVIDSVEASGISMSLDSMGITEDQRSSVYIQFNSDGTGKLCAMGEEETFNWEGNTMVSPNAPDEPLTFTYANNKVTVEQDGVKMTFAHE